MLPAAPKAAERDPESESTIAPSPSSPAHASCSSCPSSRKPDSPSRISTGRPPRSSQSMGGPQESEVWCREARPPPTQISNKWNAITSSKSRLSKGSRSLNCWSLVCWRTLSSWRSRSLSPMLLRTLSMIGLPDPWSNELV